MPEGSGGIVRAEFQGDTISDLTDSSERCCIMFSRVDVARHCDDYNSSGGSDSENDAMAWDRSPRSGHPRRRFHAHADQHGSQRGLQSVNKIQQVQHESQVTTNEEKKEQHASLPTKNNKKKQRKRTKSCLSNNKFKSDKQIDSNKENEEVEMQLAKSDFGKENGLEKVNLVDEPKGLKRKDCKNLLDLEMRTDITQKEVEYAAEQRDMVEIFKDGKEYYEKEVEMFYKIKTLITDEEKVTDEEKKFTETVIVDDSKMEKYRKDSFNVQQSLKMPSSKNFKIEKDQTDMFEKQKMKKEDVRTFEKRDKEKEVTAEESYNGSTLNMKTKGQKGEQSERAKEKHKGKSIKIDEIFDAGRHGQKEKLVVNMEQGKLGQRNSSTWYQEVDNKVLDAMERKDKEEKEQTVLKEVRDPQVGNETEKQDISKEASLGFEVDGNCAEFEEPESNSNLQNADKIWQKRQRELERCTSVDESSFSFSVEYHSTELQSSLLSSSYSRSLESKDLSDINHSCPDLYRIAVVQDSNQIRDHLDNIFWDPEALCEHNKNRIIETINTKSGKEEYFEGNEEKFRKEIIDKTERTEDKNDIDNDESEEDEADISLVNTADDDADDNDNDDDDDSNIESEAVDTAKDCITKEDSDFVDCVQTADEKRLADDIDQNGNDDEPLEIIDADEKDEVEKEKVEVFEVKTVDVEEKGRRAERPDTSVMEKILDMQGTKDTPSIPLMKTGYSVSDYTDNETIKTRHLRMCPYTRKYKKENKTDKKHERKKLPNKKLDIWMKMKKNPVVKLPEQKETDRLAPKRNWDGRRYSMFGCGEFGRKCSANGGRGGSFEGDPSSSRNQRNNEDKNSKNRRNQNNKDRDSEDKNNNNPGQNNPSVSTDTETENAVRAEPTRGIVDVSTPDDDFKRYKKKDTDTDGKKHTNLENFDWLDRTTAEIEENKGPTVNLFDRLSRGECQCVEERLDNPQELSEDALQCSICITVDSLLKHYAHCTSVFNSCDVCVKIFSLLCSHVAACIKDNSVALCEIRICKTMKIAAENNIGMHMKTLWFQVRKKLARILDDGEEDIVQQQTPVDEPKPRRPSKGLSSFSGPLPSIPEGTQLSLTSSSRSSSRVLHRKKSNLADVEEQEKSVSSEEGSSWGAAVVEAAGAQGVEEIDDESSEAVDSKHGLENASTKISYSRPEIPDEADAIPTSSEEGSEESTGSVSTEGSGQFGIITGAGRYRSLPMGPPGQGEPYFPSFKDRPTGKKGIGEVVYANKHQLVVVVTIWEKFKIQYLIEAKLAKHYTEEGVILPEFKSKLRIKGLRYQNEFQWVKVAHLGNGMTGKCHLATDFETDFKFCVKEIHISNYEKEEIELWSELEHPYVVQVYGAIRHGEKIYILQEFIEGGCLTEAINVQRKLSRRLSQLTALRYFQQLLEVLKYLKSRNILHEDLKADNILLNKNSDPVTIKVADFGLARRCQGSVRSGTKPVGTQTQWSPEKAEARVGYGFAAEVWASICVLVHMLSGQPPWVRRYESFKALIVVIVEKSPPMEDIPRNIHESIKDLIKRGFTVCQGQRPTAEQLLEHGAFRLLDEAAALQSMNGTYSILESLHFESQTNQIDYDPNADLREIFRNLERDRAQGAAANNGTRRKDKKGSVVSVYNEEVPYYSNEYRVYTSGLGEGDGKKNVNSQLSLRQATEYSNKALQGTEHQKNGAGSSDSVDIYTRSRLPSHPDNNIDPTTHINKFFNDIAGPTIPPNVQPNLVIYHPSLESIGSQKGNSGSQHSSLENLSSGTVTNKLIPDFGKIGMLPDPGEGFDSGSSEEENEDDVLKNFDFKKAVEHVGEQYTLPTVLNSSVDMSPGSQFTSAHSSSLPTEKDNDVPKVDNQERNTVQTKPETTVPAYSGDDHIQSFNEDDLFKSGSPPGLVGIGLHQQIYPVSVPNNQSVLPLSALTNFMQTNVGQHSYMHPSPRNAVTVSAQEFQHRVVSRTGSRDFRAENPSIQQHGHDTMQNWYMQNQSSQQQAGSQSRQQIEMQSIHQPAGTQSMQQHLQTQSRQYGGSQSRQQQMEISRQQFQIQQTRQQPYLTQSQSYNLLPQDSNPTYQHNRGQDQVYMFQYGQGQSYNQRHDNISPQGSSSTYHGDRFEHLPRSESQPGELVRSERLSSSDNRNPYENISMPYQAGRLHATPFHPLSLAAHPHFNPYQTSTPRSEGHHNGARPKVPQTQRQLFPSTENSQNIYGRRNTGNTDMRIYDPRKVYEESLGGATYKQYTGYTAQPRTPLLNPVINPRPPLQQEGQRMELRLDINKAQLVPEMPVLSHAQTAPVFSPPKTPSKKSPDFHRTQSYMPITVRKSPSLTGPGVTSASSSQKEDKMSTSTSRSQFEEQDEAFRELGRTAEEALSQHSDHGPGIFMFHEDDDFDDQVEGEIEGEIDDRYLENPAESLAHVLDPVQDTSIAVIFRSNTNGKEFKMNFFRKHASLTWEKIIKEELDGFSRVSMATEYELQRFCLRRQDGSVIDLDSCLGNRSCTVIMIEATDSDPWWIEGGMIAK